MKKVSRVPARIRKLPIERRAEMAIQAAVRKAIIRRFRLGLPVYIWRNGKVVEMPLAELKKYRHQTR